MCCCSLYRTHIHHSDGCYCRTGSVGWGGGRGSDEKGLYHIDAHHITSHHLLIPLTAHLQLKLAHTACVSNPFYYVKRGRVLMLKHMCVYLTAIRVCDRRERLQTQTISINEHTSAHFRNSESTFVSIGTCISTCMRTFTCKCTYRQVT